MRRLTLSLAALSLALAFGPASGRSAAAEPQPGHWSVYFSPHGGCTEAVVRALAGAKATVLVQAYSFTSAPIAGALSDRIGGRPLMASGIALQAGAQIIGPNCGNGMKQMIEIVKEMRAAAGTTPILVHANAGLPRNVNGVDVFPEGPEEMAGQVKALVDAGAGIVGGCCGTTPAHIQAIRNVVDTLC